MKQTATAKILAAHLVEGDPAKDSEIGICIDQTASVCIYP